MALAGFWIFASSFQGLRSPVYTASADLPGIGLAVSTELYTLSDLTEFERRLLLTAPDGTIEVRMPDILGPADRTALYQVGGGAEIAVFGPGGAGPFVAAQPLRRLDHPSRPPADWTCLGVFELSLVQNTDEADRNLAQTFAFVPAAGASDGASAPGSAADGCPRP